MAVFDAPRGTGPYGITTTPEGGVFFASLAGNYVGRIEYTLMIEGCWFRFAAGRSLGSGKSLTARVTGSTRAIAFCRPSVIQAAPSGPTITPWGAAPGPRIAVGDTLTLRFGSYPKEYAFPVARIDLKGQHCAIFSEAEGNRHRIDKINVAPCHRAPAER